jgi:hypothetical protein
MVSHNGSDKASVTGTRRPPPDYEKLKIDANAPVGRMITSVEAAEDDRIARIVIEVTPICSWGFRRRGAGLVAAPVSNRPKIKSATDQCHRVVIGNDTGLSGDMIERAGGWLYLGRHGRTARAYADPGGRDADAFDARRSRRRDLGLASGPLRLRHQTHFTPAFRLRCVSLRT